MQDSSLFKIALVTGIIGLLLLYMMYERTDLQEYSLAEASSMDDYEDVRITGKVIKVIERGNVTIVTITKPEYIDVVVFDKIKVEKDTFVQVEGQIQSYNGEKQVLASSIVQK